MGTKGYSKTLRLIRRVGAEFADEVIEHSFFVKQDGGGQRQMVNFEFVFQRQVKRLALIISNFYSKTA